MFSFDHELLLLRTSLAVVTFWNESSTIHTEEKKVEEYLRNIWLDTAFGRGQVELMDLLAEQVHSPAEPLSTLHLACTWRTVILRWLEKFLNFCNEYSYSIQHAHCVYMISMYVGITGGSLGFRPKCCRPSISDLQAWGPAVSWPHSC